MGPVSSLHAQWQTSAPWCSFWKALHVAGVVYRDLKPENVDFGAAKKHVRWQQDLPLFLGTVKKTWRRRDLLFDTGYSLEADFWSLGVLFYEMVCGFRFPLAMTWRKITSCLERWPTIPLERSKAAGSSATTTEGKGKNIPSYWRNHASRAEELTDEPWIIWHQHFQFSPTASDCRAPNGASDCAGAFQRHLKDGGKKKHSDLRMIIIMIFIKLSQIYNMVSYGA